MTGLAALQPDVNAEWFGEWNDGEMLMSATGKDPAGNLVRSKIRFYHIAKDSFRVIDGKDFDADKFPPSTPS
jgi:hypothetical protein